MKKILLVALSPLFISYLFFGIFWYIYAKDDVHFSTLADVVSWFWQ